MHLHSMRRHAGSRRTYAHTPTLRNVVASLPYMLQKYVYVSPATRILHPPRLVYAAAGIKSLNTQDMLRPIKCDLHTQAEVVDAL